MVTVKPNENNYSFGLNGNSQRQAARRVSVSHGTVANWFKEYADSLPDVLPVPSDKVDVAEQDELFTFVGKKNEAYVMTIVDRETRCFPAIQAVFQRSQEIGQAMLNQAPAQQYYSDMFPLYNSLSYRKGYHLSLPDKSETYSVEADNAELRHYLTRLTRRSRCFSCCIAWLNRYLKAFAHAWNLRQIHNHTHPYYKKHVIEFVCLQS